MNHFENARERAEVSREVNDMLDSLSARIDRGEFDKTEAERGINEAAEVILDIKAFLNEDFIQKNDAETLALFSSMWKLGDPENPILKDKPELKERCRKLWGNEYGGGSLDRKKRQMCRAEISKHLYNVASGMEDLDSEKRAALGLKIMATEISNEPPAKAVTGSMYLDPRLQDRGFREELIANMEASNKEANLDTLGQAFPELGEDFQITSVKVITGGAFLEMVNMAGKFEFNNMVLTEEKDGSFTIDCQMKNGCRGNKTKLRGKRGSAERDDDEVVDDTDTDTDDDGVDVTDEGVTPEAVEPTDDGAMPEGVTPVDQGITPEGVTPTDQGVMPEGVTPVDQGITPEDLDPPTFDDDHNPGGPKFNDQGNPLDDAAPTDTETTGDDTELDTTDTATPPEDAPPSEDSDVIDDLRDGVGDLVDDLGDRVDDLVDGVQDGIEDLTSGDDEEAPPSSEPRPWERTWDRIQETITGGDDDTAPTDSGSPQPTGVPEENPPKIDQPDETLSETGVESPVRVESIPDDIRPKIKEILDGDRLDDGISTDDIGDGRTIRSEKIGDEVYFQIDNNDGSAPSPWYRLIDPDTWEYDATRKELILPAPESRNSRITISPEEQNMLDIRQLEIPSPDEVKADIDRRLRAMNEGIKDAIDYKFGEGFFERRGFKTNYEYIEGYGGTEGKKVGRYSIRYQMIENVETEFGKSHYVDTAKLKQFIDGQAQNGVTYDPETLGSWLAVKTLQGPIYRVLTDQVIPDIQRSLEQESNPQ